MLLLAIPTWACNIPVFRYALERWRSDQLKLVIFHSEPLNEDEAAQIQSLQAFSASKGGNTNFELEVVDVAEQKTDEQARLWEGLDAALKERVGTGAIAALQGRHIRGLYSPWQGRLLQTKTLVSSPVRKEIASRLVRGDAIVWCVLAGPDQEATDQLVAQLEMQTRSLAQELELPEGIGLPGSELFAEVPLLLQFSVLKIQRDAPDEQLLLRLFKGFQPEAFDRGEPLIVPVFGRGRALEVIPSSTMGPRLFEDLTRFLCAACSCQVKEQNPGFDLLIDMNWDDALFGAEGERPPPTEEGLGQQKQPRLLTIPPGRSGR